MRSFRRKYKRYQKGVLKGLIIPDVLYTKHKYKLNFNFGAGAATAAAVQFRGNSLYDPDATGVGLTVAGFREYMNFYLEYCVLASSIRWEITSNSAVSINYTVRPDYDLTNPSENGTFLPEENRYTKAYLCGATTLGNHNAKVLKNYMSTAKIYGMSPRFIKDSPDFYGVTNSNPTRQWYWLLSGYDYSGASAQAAICKVTITYYAMYRKRKELNGQVL